MTRMTASGVLPAAESEMIVTGLLGYCWACACTWAAADSGSSQKHAIIRECEHNLTFMSPARDQCARTTTRFCTPSLLIVVAEAPARRRIDPDKPSSPPTKRSANRVTLAKNIMTQLRGPLKSRVIHFYNDSSIDIVGERLGLFRSAAAELRPDYLNSAGRSSLTCMCQNSDSNIGDAGRRQGL
jgi:hypothetical protein